MQSAHVRLKDIVSLLHRQVVLLDKRVGHVKLLVKDEVHKIVNHSHLFNSQLIVCLVPYHRHSLLINAHARCLARVAATLNVLSWVLNATPLNMNLQIVLLCCDFLDQSISFLYFLQRSMPIEICVKVLIRKVVRALVRVK